MPSDEDLDESTRTDRESDLPKLAAHRFSRDVQVVEVRRSGQAHDAGRTVEAPAQDNAAG
ncbi:MAG: hypothetical protein JWO90_1194 [Solirubrobacterales bacterium]|jgi:hypothetical protein|nr:hypothetical protein [Solirubrobacterales bacterium]